MRRLAHVTRKLLTLAILAVLSFLAYQHVSTVVQATRLSHAAALALDLPPGSRIAPASEPRLGDYLSMAVCHVTSTPCIPVPALVSVPRSAAVSRQGLLAGVLTLSDAQGDVSASGVAWKGVIGLSSMPVSARVSVPQGSQFTLAVQAYSQD